MTCIEGYRMNLFEAFRRRRSTRSFTKEEVAKEAIGALLEAAIRAPSACNRQTWGSCS